MNFFLFATISFIFIQQFSFLFGKCINLQTITVCENYPLVIQCPPDQSINIISGFYGRNDTTTCMTEYPGCAGCDTTCSFDITNQLMNSFDQKNNLELTITTDFTGIDPCYGTYKYSFISYKCV